jgi:hypothetical protein
MILFKTDVILFCFQKAEPDYLPVEPLFEL